METSNENSNEIRQRKSIFVLMVPFPAFPVAVFREFRERKNVLRIEDFDA